MVQPPGHPRRGLNRWAIAAPLLAALLFVHDVPAQQALPGRQSEQRPAIQSAWSAAALAEAQKFSEQIHSTGVVIVHRGAVVAEWGNTTKRTELASVRKSLLSALIGIAVADGKISLDSTLAQLGIDDNPPALTEVEKQATVRMLLQARSGIYHPALYETAAMARARPTRGSHAPGAFFYYNNWDFNALGTIYERATGTGIYDALDRLIAKRSACRTIGRATAYFTGADSIHRAYPLRMSARDLARFALLYLRDGKWSGGRSFRRRGA
jgi:CubicO group peptidase (beta-lactamase class C family)